MKDIYEIIELQFYKDLKASEKELEEEKRIVEEIMKANSVDYALELVENQKRSYYEEVYHKGYTLNLVIKKIDLHYVLKLLDQNKIGFFASNEDKQKEIEENEIQYEEDEAVDFAIYGNNDINQEIDPEELERRNETVDAGIRIWLTVCFGMILAGDIYFSYWLYTIKLYNYLMVTILFTILQVWLFGLIYKNFRQKKDLL